MFSLELIWIGFNLVTVSPFFLSFFKKLFFSFLLLFFGVAIGYLFIYQGTGKQCFFIQTTDSSWIFFCVRCFDVIALLCLLLFGIFYLILLHDLEFDLDLTIGHWTTVLNITDYLIYKSSWMPWAAERLICTVLLTSYYS